MKRLDQFTLVVSFTALSWLTMQAVHEFGHVLGAWLSGVDIRRVVLHPLMISRTELGENPHPLVVVWGGPLMGSVLPVLIYVLARSCRFPALYLFRCFAGFCLIANGVYIAFGPARMAADTGIMLYYGTPRWIMLVFGSAASAAGMFLWHGQGSYFGLGAADGAVSRAAAMSSAFLLAGTVCVELMFFGW